MAGQVTSMDIKMLVATLPEDANISQWCKKLGISRETAYKWRKRFADQGPEGLAERPRTPKQIHGKTNADTEDLIVRIRKELKEEGLDHGPASVGDRLRLDRNIALPDSTIWRILKRRGQINEQPQKRPRSSWKRFERSRPNECWQGDDTHYFLADGSEVRIINMIDDHSRLNPFSLAATNATSEKISETFYRATAEFGVPMEFLNDNGRAWISQGEFAPVTFQANLLRIGVKQIHTSPYHPQTNGKVERFHGTQRKWLDARPSAKTIEQLQELLDEFRLIYNTQRPHRALNRKTTQSAWEAQRRATPPTEALQGPMTVGLSSAKRQHQSWKQP